MLFVVIELSLVGWCVVLCDFCVVVGCYNLCEFVCLFVFFEYFCVLCV